MAEEPNPPRALFLDMTCPCGAKFCLEYTRGTGVLNELISVALRWVTDHKHQGERSGPSENNRPPALPAADSSLPKMPEGTK